MIKAIIFDFYGVIRSDEYHDWLARHGFKRDEIRSEAKQLDKGLTTVDQFFESLSKLSDMPADKIRKEFLAESSLNEELLSLILELKKRYKIALLSNASSSYLREVLREAGINKLFDEVIVSSEIGYVKPSKEIFDHTLNKLGIRADEAVFIDDNEGFCLAAERFGIKSLRFTDMKSLVSELKQIGIINN